MLTNLIDMTGYVSNAFDCIAIDTECTGLSFLHGAAPWVITTTHWDKVVQETTNKNFVIATIDPFTREPQYDQKEIQRFANFIAQRERSSDYEIALLFHNFDYDIKALNRAGITVYVKNYDDIYPASIDEVVRIECGLVEDTMLASHTSDSLDPRGLKELSLKYLRISTKDQKKLQEQTVKARRIGKKRGWKLGESVEGKPMVAADYWMVHQLHEEGERGFETDYSIIYAELDTERTWELWSQLYSQVFTQAYLHEKTDLNPNDRLDKYRKAYIGERRLLPVIHNMELSGLHFHDKDSMAQLQETSSILSQKKGDAQRLSGNKEFNVNSGPQLQEVLFNKFKLKPIKETESGNPSTDMDSLVALKDGERKGSRSRRFLKSIIDYRLNIAQQRYLTNYIANSVEYEDGYYISPSFFQVGTHSTRLSSSNPNAQNIGEQEHCNLRKVFGPAPGHIWYAIDYDNIEMRLFAYASGDEQLIAAFEQGDSVHNIICKILHPKLYAECERDGVSFKDRYKKTWYQWVKNGNFSLIYGAGEAKADAAYHVKGAYKKIRKTLPKIDALMNGKHQEARKNGNIFTMFGYPLSVPKDGPHKAVNYFIQGTAGGAIKRAMFNLYNEMVVDFDSVRICAQIHDELIFDIDLSSLPEKEDQRDVLDEIVYWMEEPGDEIGVPLTVTPNIITERWSDTQTVNEYFTAA